MAYRLTMSKEAQDDIDDIVQYISLRLANPGAASDFLDDVVKSFTSVTDNPRMYSYCADKRLQKDGYRKIAIKNYLVIYRIVEDKKVVYIVRIIYGGMNYTVLL